MRDPSGRYYSAIPEKTKRGPYSPQEKKNLLKIFGFILLMTALGALFGFLLLQILKTVL